MSKKLLAIPVALGILALFAFVVPAYACHATGGADCDGWWVNVTGPGDGWILDHVVGATSGSWEPGQTHVDYDVTAYYKQWVASGYYAYVDRPTTPPVYDCELTENIHGTNYDVSDFYVKPTGDDHHCHRINWGDLTPSQQDAFKAMHHNDPNYSSPNHGNWQSAYNSHIDQNPTAHLVTPGGYDSCPVGYEVVPGNQSRCRQWVDTSHYIYQSYHFTGTINRPDCYEACDVTVAQTPTIQWGDWSPWVYDPQLDLETSFRDGVETTVFVDSRDPQLVCDSQERPVHEERTREVDYPAWSLIPVQDCNEGWSYEVDVPEGAQWELIEGALSGEWLNSYGPEDNAAFLPTVVVTWPSGYAEQATGVLIVKDEGCIECRVTRLYPQAVYLDPNAPVTYWQGPFGRGAGVCAVIHPEGQTPSAERVTTICSLCPDQIDGGYVYHGEREFIDDYVYRLDCWGQEPHYVFAGFNWDAYVRSDFTREGIRTSCRVQGCADWIHEAAGHEVAP
jgi:hypothetical protein